MTGQQTDPVRLLFPSRVTACRGMKRLADCAAPRPVRAGQGDRRPQPGQQSRVLRPAWSSDGSGSPQEPEGCPEERGSAFLVPRTGRLLVMPSAIVAWAWVAGSVSGERAGFL